MLSAELSLLIISEILDLTIEYRLLLDLLNGLYLQLECSKELPSFPLLSIELKMSIYSSFADTHSAVQVLTTFGFLHDFVFFVICCIKIFPVYHVFLFPVAARKLVSTLVPLI